MCTNILFLYMLTYMKLKLLENLTYNTLLPAKISQSTVYRDAYHADIMP